MTSSEIFLTYISIILEMSHRNKPIVARQEEKILSGIVVLISGISLSKNINPNCAIGSLKKMSRQLFLGANDDVE